MNRSFEAEPLPGRGIAAKAISAEAVTKIGEKICIAAPDKVRGSKYQAVSISEMSLSAVQHRVDDLLAGAIELYSLDR